MIDAYNLGKLATPTDLRNFLRGFLSADSWSGSLSGEVRQALYLAKDALMREEYNTSSSDRLTLSAEEIGLWKEGQKIAAIKLVRNRLNLTLRDAKELLEFVFSEKMK